MLADPGPIPTQDLNLKSFGDYRKIIVKAYNKHGKATEVLKTLALDSITIDRVAKECQCTNVPLPLHIAIYK
jgi:hypothetical protein